MKKQSKHENYEVLNLIGYGLAKFDIKFVRSFGFNTKTAFYKYMMEKGISETIGAIKNRQDLFDPFFDNNRSGWWQKGNAYIHRKNLIDSLFGSLDVKDYANIVKLFIEKKFNVVVENREEISPIIQSKFKQLQVTGQEAELFFMHNYKVIKPFENGILEDARLFGDGYDFQINVQNHFLLAEIKGLRTNYGSIRMTQNEYDKAKEYKHDYALIVVNDLAETPKMSIIFDPANNIEFTIKAINSKQINYHTVSIKWHSIN